jgi:transcription termination factor NusB
VTDPATSRPAPRSARRVALDVLRRIESDGAYANLVLGPILASSGLSDPDRRFATELVYGTTRMRRACDAVIDRFVTSPPDDATRSVLRLGAYQLVFAGVAPHAAVSETVGLAPKRTRGFVNAVLRKVARLSIPGLYVEMLRPKRVLVRGLDLDGEIIEIEADELEARMFQHEIDHLNGVLMFDRLEGDQRKEAMREYRRIEEAAARQAARPQIRRRLGLS